jgi:TonB family protein
VLIRVVAPRPGENPSLGYRISLTGEPGGKKAFGRVQALSTKLTKEEFQAGERVGGEWQQLTVRAVGDEIVSTLNGRVVSRVEGREHRVGNVGIEVKRGALEFRKLRVASLGAPTCSDGSGARSTASKPENPGVQLPKVVSEVRPHYTIEAMSDKTQGTVWVEAVVMADGTVGDVCVSKPLDLDLDLEALAAAKQWKFKAGTRDGQPVTVLVTIELTFTLR